MALLPSRTVESRMIGELPQQLVNGWANAMNGKQVVQGGFNFERSSLVLPFTDPRTLP